MSTWNEEERHQKVVEGCQAAQRRALQKKRSGLFTSLKIYQNSKLSQHWKIFTHRVVFPLDGSTSQSSNRASSRLWTWPYRVQFPEYCSIEEQSSAHRSKRESADLFRLPPPPEWRHQNLVKISLVPLKWIYHSQFICALFPLWHFGGPYGNGLPWSARRNVYFSPKWNEGTVEDARF